MSVTLTPETGAMIQQRIDSGRYDDANEVVQEALRLLNERDRLEHLRSLVAVGLEAAQRGEAAEFTPEFLADIDRRADEWFRQGIEPAPDVCP